MLWLLTLPVCVGVCSEAVVLYSALTHADNCMKAHVHTAGDCTETLHQQQQRQQGMGVQHTCTLQLCKFLQQHTLSSHRAAKNSPLPVCVGVCGEAVAARQLSQHSSQLSHSQVRPRQ
jgi:hypothetical protein